MNNGFSIELLKLLYVFSFSLGIWTCLSTFINQHCPKDVKWVLLSFIFILLVMPFNGYLGLVMEFPPLFLNSMASTINWTYGPLVWLLANSVTQARTINKFAVLHFLPFIVAANVHFMALSWLDFNIYHLALFLQVMGYLSKAYLELFKSRTKLIVLGKEFKNSTYYWMLFLIGGLGCLTLYEMALLLMLQNGVGVSYLILATTVCGFSVFISTISILSLIHI